MVTTTQAVGMDVLCALLDDDLSDSGAAALTGVIAKLPLAAADLTNGLGGTLVRALTGPTDQDGMPPGRTAATALATVVTQAHRMVGWWQAIELRAMAALARPGVATPLDQVLSAASSVLTSASAGVECAHDGDESGLLSRDFEVEQYSGTSVCGRPEWDATVADHAARFAAAEIGASLGMSPVTAAARVSEAVMFVDELPETLTCWGNGTLDRPHALALANSTAVLEPAARRAVEQQLLGHDGGRTAGRWTPSRLRSRADRLVICCDPDAARRRRERARQDRRLEVSPLEDGMARFAAVVDAPVATLAHGVLDTVARGLGREGLVGRTLAQTRADVFADLMVALAVDGRVDVRGSGLGTRAEGARVDGARSEDAHADGSCSDGAERLHRANHPVPGSDVDSVDGAAGLPPRWCEIGSAVSVIIDADSLVEPGFLEGHGWIPPELARALALSSQKIQIVVRQPDAPEPDRTEAPDPQWRPLPTSGPADSTAAAAPPSAAPAGSDPAAAASVSTGRHTGSPWCGGCLDLGTTVYRPPTALDEHVRRRDRVCRFPGCRRSSSRCDLDHRIPFDQGGPTCPCNLDALCRFHHRLKTFTGWTAIRLPGGRLAWRSPLGHRHVDEPEPMPGDDAILADSGRRIGPADDPPPF